MTLFKLLKTQADRTVSTRIDLGWKREPSYAKKEIQIFDSTTVTEPVAQKEAYKNYAKSLLEYFDNKMGPKDGKGDGKVSKEEFVNGQIFINTFLFKSYVAGQKIPYYENTNFSNKILSDIFTEVYDSLTKNKSEIAIEDLAKIIEKIDARDGDKDGKFNIENEWKTYEEMLLKITA